jgi:regulator of sigma E protease
MISLKKASTFFLIFIGLGFIIFFHELGHFFACKVFNVGTPTFSIGFGPSIVRKKIGSTTFQLSLFPLGGFVSIDRNDIADKPYWQKMIIVFAGIFNNFLLCLLCMMIVFFTIPMNIKPIISSIDRDSPAYQAGLEPHDEIIALNGHCLNKSALSLLELIHRMPDAVVNITVQRNNEQITVPIQLGSKKLLGMQAGELGATFFTERSTLQGFRALKSACYFIYTLLLDNFFMLLNARKMYNKRIITRPIALIAIHRHTITKLSDLFLIFIATTSIQIGFFNALPVPMLDGGQALRYTVERIAGRSLNDHETSMLYVVVIMFFLGLLLLYNRKESKKSQQPNL